MSPPPISSPSNNSLESEFRLTFQCGRKGPCTVSVHLVAQRLNNWFHVLCGEMFEGRNVQTTKPFGEGGRKRCLVKEEALHLKEPDITSQAHFTKGFSRQSVFMDSGELQRQKNLTMLLQWWCLALMTAIFPPWAMAQGFLYSWELQLFLQFGNMQITCPTTHLKD